MNILKELRSRYGQTQADLAQKLKTTQQTVARWETGKTEIPVHHLRELAVIFGCTVDTLLGVAGNEHKRSDKQFAQVDHDIPFGTARITFDFGQREYPIDEKTSSRIEEFLCGKLGLNGNEGWLEFGALDNKLVLLNLNAVFSIDLISDDAEEMPEFFHPEVYHALETENWSPGGELEEQIQQLKDGLTEEEVEWVTSYTGIVYRNGDCRHVYLEEEGVTGILQLSLGSFHVPANAFTVAHAEGPHVRTLVNLSQIAVIEVPLERYLRELEDAAV